MEKINNGIIELTTSNIGCEFQSIKYKEKEYLWNGDITIWKFRSPMLFPIVGFLKDNECFIDGKRYEMPVNHGFGKLASYKVISLTNNEVKYELTSSEETLKEYPYEFVLHVTYKLENNQIKVIWNVLNKSNKTMYYHIGAHTGFSLRLNDDDKTSDYYLELDEPKKLNIFEFANNLTGDKHPFKEDAIQQINFEEEIKKHGVVILENVSNVTLKSHRHNHSVRLDFEKLPLIGLWHPQMEDCPFVCLEPWHGIMDNKNTDKNFLNKAFLISLKPNESYETGYTITLN